MPGRLKITLAAAAGCAAVAVLVVALTGSNAGPLRLANGFAGATEPPAIPAQDFALRDQDGRPVRLSDYAGRVAIITFLYSTCTTTCPVTAQQLRGALDLLGRPVPTLAVSVDPKNDTPLSAARFLVKQSMSGRMRFLLGTRAELAPIWRAYGIRPQTALARSPSDHSAEVVLIDKVGRPRVGFPQSELTPEAVAHDIRKLEGEAPPRRAPRRHRL